ncbi:MAG TPA: hypothetical protein VFH68_10190 [Polyangia bacterium]|nr:hypothetical protein [Polyangia bacterium]
MRASLVARWLILTAAVTMAGSADATSPLPVAAPTTGAGPAATPSRSDLEARDLFQARRYSDALAIYLRLYTETQHPTYLRNIGRCHQMMREPDPAIASFRAYLRDARDLDPSERAEIEGYIGEMQRLKLNAPAPSALPPPDGRPPGDPSSTAPGASATGATSSARDADARPITHRWWFWTAIGVLAVTGVIAAVVAGGANDRLPCPAGAVCPP